MFDIYDPRRGKGFTYEDFGGTVLISTLKDYILFFQSADETQVYNEKIVSHLARLHFIDTRLFLQVRPSTEKITSEMKTRFKGASFLCADEHDISLITDTNKENIKILEGCYKDLQDWEEWNIGFIKPEKEAIFLEKLNHMKHYDTFELFKLREYFKAIFSTSFEVPLLWLMFFEESKFDDVIQSVPLV